MNHRPQAARPRLESIDALRGVAIAMMFIYHFCYDLSYFGFADFNFYHDPRWIYFRIVIVSSFLLLVGVSLYLATRHGLNRRAFIKRLAWLIAYAAIISVISYIMFRERLIFFGILHFIAVASVVGLLFARLYWLNLVSAIAIIVIGLTVKHPFFDQSAWQWLGMVTTLPRTEDYVQFIPWFGVVLLGMFLGQLLFDRKPLKGLVRWQSRHPLSRTLTLGGRHSLHIYMLHQPIFMGMLFVVASVVRG